MSDSHSALAIRTYIATGGAAGAITVTGIAVNDKLIAVIEFAGGGTDVTALNDRTAEFTISAADTIDNTGGTATTGDQLLVITVQADVRGDSLNRN